MNRKILILSLPILLLGNEFETTLQNEINWLEEETFVVSASRIKEALNKTPASVTLIDSDMIEKMDAENLFDVLSTVPGIGITQSNIYIDEIESRGIKDWFSKQILFMIDGHALDANLINGGVTLSFSDIKLETIKQIEIIKGPASALYGANAFTGLVNIITKKASDINGVAFTGKYGSFDTKEANVLFGKQFDELSIMGDINAMDSNGYEVHVKKDAINNAGTTHPYKKQIQTNFKLGYKDLFINTMFNHREDGPHFGATGAINNDTVTKNDYLFIETGLHADITHQLNINAKMYYDLSTFDNRWGLPQYNLIQCNALKNRKTGIEALATYSVTDTFSTIFGGMYEKHQQFDIKTRNNNVDVSHTAESFAPIVDREMEATYINTLYDPIPNVRITLGVRYDHYSDFGSNIAPRGGFSWQISKHHSLKAMYGEGFRAPTFAELYSNHTVINGAIDLNPEKVKTYEITHEYDYDRLHNKLTYFDNTFTDLIVQDDSNYYNRGASSTRGVEIETKYDLYRGSYLLGNYTYLEAKDDKTDQELSDVASHRGNIMFNYRINRYLNSFTHLLFKGETKRATEDERQNVAAYGILNTTIQVKDYLKNTEFKLLLNNLTDKQAYDPARDGLIYDDYEIARRNFMLEVTYTFN